MNKITKLSLSLAIASLPFTSVNASNDMYVGVNVFKHNLTLGDDEKSSEININLKAGMIINQDRVYIQTGKLYDNDGVSYSSTTLNYDFNLGKEDGITAYAGVHIGQDTFKINGSSNKEISKGFQVSFTKELFKNQELETGFRYTDSNNQIESYKVNYAHIFYIAYNFKF